MGKNSPQLEKNPFYSARKTESENNEIFASREKASEYVRIETTRLAKIESGKVIPYPEEVCSMAKAYNAPELCNIYCSDYCQIGMGNVRKHDISMLDRIAFRVLGSLKDAEKLQEQIIEIIEDGEITPDEYSDIDEILSALDKITDSAQSLRLWVQKNVKEVINNG